MNLVVLHKFDGFDPWGTIKGQRIVVNFDYVKRFYERHEVTHGGSFSRSGIFFRRRSQCVSSSILVHKRCYFLRRVSEQSFISVIISKDHRQYNRRWSYFSFLNQFFRGFLILSLRQIFQLYISFCMRQYCPCFFHRMKHDRC